MTVVSRQPGPDSDRTRRAAHGRAFSLTELLVVIGIIALLVSLLLVALGKAQQRARATQTLTTMNAFSQACETFQIDHRRYPGVLPETLLAQNSHITSTENAILDLMGGWRLRTPYDSLDGRVFREYQEWEQTNPNLITQAWQNSGYVLKCVPPKIGEGPYLDLKLYAPYYTPGQSEVLNAQGSFGGAFGGYIGGQLPDLVDGWGQPILYTRRVRKDGPLVGSIVDSPQFLIGGLDPYLQSTSLGELGRNQIAGGMGDGRSVLTGNATTRFQNFAQLIRHPAFGDADDPINTGEARGEFVLISAGPDGIYFSATDGPGSPDNPITDLIGEMNPPDPGIAEEYDDVRVFGGG